MHYHDNVIKFKNGDNCRITNGSFVIRHYRYTSGQDPDHHLAQGVEIPFGSSGELTFSLGRDLSDGVEDWFNQTVRPKQTTFRHSAGSLHFAILGDLTINGQFLGFSDQPIVIEGVMLAQGRDGLSNNWWFGCTWVSDDASRDHRLWFDGAGQSFIYSFLRGGNDANEIELNIQGFSGGGPGPSDGSGAPIDNEPDKPDTDSANVSMNSMGDILVSGNASQSSKKYLVDKVYPRKTVKSSVTQKLPLTPVKKDPS